MPTKEATARDTPNQDHRDQDQRDQDQEVTEISNSAPASDESSNFAGRNDPLLRPLFAQSDAGPATPAPAPSDEREIVRAAINFSDFSKFGVETEDGEIIFVLLMVDQMDVRGITRGADRVVLLDEATCLRHMVTEFFEIKKLTIAGDKASLSYSYPVGAHFGSLSLERVGSSWKVTNKSAIRSSSGRRDRLKDYYARIPGQKLPGGDRSPELLDSCTAGDAESCKSYAVAEHNLGRLEAAELLYDRACQLKEVESCHNLAMLHVKGGKLQQGLQELSQLCTENGISLSCAMHDKYSETRDK